MINKKKRISQGLIDMIGYNPNDELNINYEPIYIMKVNSVELIESNKRERVQGGVYIEFDSIDNVIKDDYFQISLDKYPYYFQAISIKVVGENLRISAREVGYWASKISEKGIDLRKVIGLEVISITDIDKKREIYKQSCWC